MSSQNYAFGYNRSRDVHRSHRHAWVITAVAVVSFTTTSQASERSFPPSPPASPLTLQDCYALALKRSETIAIDQQVIKETEGRFLQALSAALPRASFQSSDKRQDGSGSSAFTLRYVPQRQFVFSQPLFSGFKEFAAMAGSRAERRQRIQEKVRAEQLLFVDVADAFYLLLEQREDRGTLEATRIALVDRLDELHERQRVGRSRATEVVTAEAQLRRVEAQLEQAHSSEEVSQHLLEFLTGLDHTDALADPDMALPALETEETYLAKAERRPDLRASEEAWHVAEKAVRVAQGGLFPTASLDGNYYIDRVGVSADVKWDAALMVDVPIFQGGQAVGAIREAAAKAREAKLRYTQQQRSVALDIRDAYARADSSLAITKAFQKALEAAEESYRLEAEDYRLNLVSNLEALQTLQALQDARRDSIHGRYDAKRRYWQLRVAAGAIP